MTEYTVSTELQHTIRRLSSDPIAYAVALKMVTLHPEACTVTLFENQTGWAAATEMRTSVSRWDREAYPNTSTVATFDGTDESLLRIAFEHAAKESCVFKVTNPIVQILVSNLPHARWVQTFTSYTIQGNGSENRRRAAEIVEHTTVNQETVRLFDQTGYTREELEALVARGARWFGFFRLGSCLSVCLVYPTGSGVWEIGGVYTNPENRRKGYAKAVVQGAVQTLLERGHRPRYVFRVDNEASQAVAEWVGLTYANSIEHYLIE